MESIFTSLGHALEGAIWLALGASFAWGVLSVLLSPCHLASIPLIVGFIDRQGRLRAKRAFLTSLLFAAGILATIALIGALTAAAGRMLGQIGPWTNYAVAAVFFLIGLHFLDVVGLPFSGPSNISMKRKGLLAALIMGLVFGLALGPCTFAFMAPMLAVTLRVSAESPLSGIALLGAYGAGHCSLIVLAGTFTASVQQYLDWNSRSRGSVVLRRVCGVLVLAGGLYLIYTAQA